MSTMLFGWFFVVFGLLFAGVAISLVVAAIRHRQRLQTWTPTSAIIREIETRRTSSTRVGGSHAGSHGGSRTQLIAHYEYRGPHGEEYADEGPIPSQRFATDGSPLTLRIVVDPLDPSRSVIAEETSPIGCAVTMGVFFTIFGCLFAAVGLAFTR